MIRLVAIAVVLLVFAACQPEEDPLVTGGGVIVSDVDQLAAQCRADGGRWGRTPSAGSACFRDAPDANDPCASANDCSVLCLARSRSCAPFSPFFGCHEVLTASGAQATQCTQ